MMALVPLLLLAPVLVMVAWSDLRHMRIPNALSLVAVGLFVGCAMVAPPADLWIRVGVAGVVFALGFIGFCRGLWGGGDVKFLAALMLFVPVTTLSAFSYVFSVSMLTGIGLVLGLRRIPAASGFGWKSISESTKFPMGLSIAMAGLMHPVVVTVFGIPLFG
jgi:prepilin peptidase CpaA